MRILIVGGEKLVYFLTRTFTAKGHAVTVINRHREECSRLGRRLKATIVYGDGSDPKILDEAEAAAADAVVAATPNDQDNLVICQLAREKFKVTRTLALVNDPDNEMVFQELGIRAASTTRILSGLIEQHAGYEEIVNLAPLAEGKVNATEIVLRSDGPVTGRPLADVALPPDCLVAIVLRDSHPIIPRGNTVLLAGDHLVVMTLPENHGQVLRLLTGDERPGGRPG